MLPYLDDVIIFSDSLAEHSKHLELVFNKIKAAGLILNKKKCAFGKTELKILGYILGNGKVKPDPEKCRAIQKYEKPTDLKELRSFIGLAEFSRSYIPNYAKLIFPLYDLFKGETKRSKKKIKWDKNLDNSFYILKKELLRSYIEHSQILKKNFIYLRMRLKIPMVLF